MLRDKSLIPLSHQHQHALALCVRIDRAAQAGDVDLEPWQAEIQQIYEQEIATHFSAEEKHLFPAARRIEGLQELASELLLEHAALRGHFLDAAARLMDRTQLKGFGEMLALHIRKEERQLFEGMQKAMSAEELSTIGAALADELKHSSDACLLPSAATRLKSKREIEDF
ncbi:MAG TPA: hemerythrin domain-containing protein [Terriglobales bacterium]|nr:hemerythrin domain-containing protein [Terriglobales bacterium]